MTIFFSSTGDPVTVLVLPLLTTSQFKQVYMNTMFNVVNGAVLIESFRRQVAGVNCVVSCLDRSSQLVVNALRR